MSELAKVEHVEPVAPVSESAALMWQATIERAARDPTVDIEKFERLMLMKERIEAKAAEKDFNAAVALAKGGIGPIIKNKTVDFTSQKGRTNYQHEDFAEVARTVDPVLSQHGLSYRFRSSQSAGKLKVTCILTHQSGHSEETTLEVAEDHTGNKNDIQSIGSAATYLQRYTLKLALGLASSVDTDGKVAGALISEKQEEELRKKIAALDTDIPAFCRYFKIEKFADLKATDFARAMTALNRKAAK